MLTGPVSGVLLLLESRSGVRPSDRYRAKLVPVGNGVPVALFKVMSKLSMLLPVLVTTLLKETVPPSGELATVELVMVNKAVVVTLNPDVLVEKVVPPL